MSATTLPHLTQVLQDVLTTKANRLARSSGFVQRESKLTGSLFAQTFVFSFMERAHPRWRQVVSTAADLGLAISDSALIQRCTPTAATFLQQVLGAALQASWQIEADPVAMPVLQRFTDLLIHDSTQITLPSQLASLWPGSRGELASMKLLTRLNYSTGALQIALESGKTSDKHLPLDQREYAPGSLRLADLGYFDTQELAHLEAQGVYWLTHPLARVSLYTADGRRWQIVELLHHAAYRAQAMRPEGLDLPVEVGAEQRVRARLLVTRVPRRVAAELKRRLYAQAREEGSTVSAAQVELTRWAIFITNVPVALLSVADAMVLARVRWQIELLFKLWKSHGGIDESQREKPEVILCELYAKLLAMLVIHWTCVVGLWADPARSWVKAAHIVRDHARALAIGFARADSGLLEVMLEVVLFGLQGANCRITKRKAVPATFQLLLALAEHS